MSVLWFSISSGVTVPFMSSICLHELYCSVVFFLFYHSDFELWIRFLEMIANCLIFYAGQCNNQESGSAGQGMKAWTMVANTDSLLDDESRKAIMLLRGLKGTHLFIPRIGKFRANTTVVNVSNLFCYAPVTKCFEI